MLRFLNGESNVRGGAQRELRPRVHGALHARRQPRVAGAKNYSEDDVAQLAKSFTGWYIDDKNPDNVKALFDSGRWFNGPKSVFGKLGNYNTDSVVDLVLARTATRRTSSTSCGASSSPTPPPTRDAAKALGRLRGQRPQDQAARARDPHRPAAVRVDRRAEHDQAAGRLRGRRAARHRPRRQLLGSPPTTSTRWVSSLLPADRGRLGGRPLVAQHEHRTRTLRIHRGRHRQRAERLPGEGRRRPRETPQAAFDRAFGAVERRGCRPARVRRSRTTPGAPRSRPARTGSPARSCCARSCSRAQTHR